MADLEVRVKGSFDEAEQGTEKSNVYRIACAQVLPSQNGVKGQGGLDKLEAYTKEAAQRDADVIVFPEYFLTGATHDSWRAVRKDSGDGGVSPIVPTHPDDDPDHFLSLIGDIARRNDIDIVAGTVVEMGSHHVPHRQTDEDPLDAPEDDPEHDQKLFNTVYYIDRTGKVAGRYTKKNLWHPERAVLSPGHELRHDAPKTFAVTTKRGLQLRAGIAVCWDLAFPETFREMFDLVDSPEGQSQPAPSPTLIGPDIVFAPTCWYATDAGKKGLRWNANSEAVLLDSLCITRAIENECILAMTNIAGPPFPADKAISDLSEDDAIGVGRTTVCAPFAGCVQRIDDAAETLLLATVDLQMLQDARKVYRCRHDIRQAWMSEQGKGAAFASN